MKKLVVSLSVVILVCCLAICGVFSGCGKKEEAKTNNETSAKRTTLTVGFDADFPPMGFVDDAGEYIGFDLDCARAVADELGLELKLQPIVWDAKDQELSTGKIDMIWNGFTMHVDTRDDDYTWSQPYMKNRQVVVTLTASGYDGTADLAGKKIGLQAGSTAESAVKSKEAFYNTVKDSIVLIENNIMALQELEAGKVDAVVMDSIVADYYATQKPGLYKVLSETLAEEEYGVGFLKGNTELRDLVQGALEKLAKDGTLADISNQWFGSDVTLIGK